MGSRDKNAKFAVRTADAQSLSLLPPVLITFRKEFPLGNSIVLN